MTGRVKILRGDARQLPLADNTVDLVVTSPPYFALRSYTDTVLCDRCRELVSGWGRREDWDRNLREAWPDYDAHVRAEHQQHYGGQIGSEGTPAEWLAAMLDCTREMMRVLKPSGSLFVNLGDKYAGGQAASNWSTAPLDGGRGRLPELTANQSQAANVSFDGTRPKSLMGLPWRYALRCIDDLGLILRAEIIWNKPNGLPESVTDRVRRSHEQWFHFTLQPRYYSAVDEIREAHQTSYLTQSWAERRANGAPARYGEQAIPVPVGHNPLGKLPGSVWTIPSEPLTVPPELGVDHFAAFPLEWPRRIIRGWCPAEVCTACGEGRRPVRGVDWAKVPHQSVEKRAFTAVEIVDWCGRFADWCERTGISRANLDAAAGTSDMGGWWASRLAHRAQIPTPEQWVKIQAAFEPPQELDELIHLTRLVPVANFKIGIAGALAGRHRNKEPKTRPSGYVNITGYVCACPDTTAPATPGVVLDPFGGTGTTALAAIALGRDAIHVDLSADYNRIAEWRTTDRDQLAKAMQVTRSESARDADLYDMEPLFP